MNMLILFHYFELNDLFDKFRQGKNNKCSYGNRSIHCSRLLAHQNRLNLLLLILSSCYCVPHLKDKIQIS